jgi:Zn-dependent peptidase ImmA (M78 family)
MASLASRPNAGEDAARGGAMMRCLHRDVAPVTTQDWSQIRRRRDWREVQANRGMAALLMPSRTFKDAVFDHMAQIGLPSQTSDSAAAESLASAMATTFQVSKQAALIRLSTLQLVTTP